MDLEEKFIVGYLIAWLIWHSPDIFRMILLKRLPIKLKENPYDNSKNTFIDFM